MGQFDTVKDLAAHLQQHPPQSDDQKEFGRAVLLHLAAKEKRETVLLRVLKKVRSDLDEVIKSILEADETPSATTAAPAGAVPTTAAPMPEPETAAEEDDDEGGIPPANVRVTQATSVAPNAQPATPPPTQAGTPGAPSASK